MHIFTSPGWDASPKQGNPSKLKLASNPLYSYMGGERHHENKVSCSGTQCGTMARACIMGA